MTARSLPPWALLGVALASCQAKEQAPTSAPSASTVKAAVKKPVDRLAPGELAPGEGEVFGIPVPKGMRIVGKFKRSALLVGEVRADAVANYVRDYVETRHVEIGAARTVFPAVRVKGGAPDRAYRIEVVPNRLETRLSIRDITPPPKVQGLTDAERWRRAGFTPDGKPLDPKKLE